ncbi:zinc-binding dehydrogenase [Streptomyces sp. NPDC087894]|uniref:zinc-binding dehydrogenase n=1 Tax=Streptomyces sp. NPDC087894 TaxID=3365816 RepID=UPI00381F475F
MSSACTSSRMARRAAREAARCARSLTSGLLDSSCAGTVLPPAFRRRTADRAHRPVRSGTFTHGCARGVGACGVCRPVSVRSAALPRLPAARRAGRYHGVGGGQTGDCIDRRGRERTNCSRPAPSGAGYRPSAPSRRGSRHRHRPGRRVRGRPPAHGRGRRRHHPRHRHGPGLADLAKAAKPGGTLVTAGWLDPRPASFPMNWPLTIIGYASFEHTLDPTVVRRIAAFLEAGLRTGALRPTVDRVFGLDDTVAAHAYLEEGHQVGKIVVTV